MGYQGIENPMAVSARYTDKDGSAVEVAFGRERYGRTSPMMATCGPGGRWTPPRPVREWERFGSYPKNARDAVAWLTRFVEET
jgi:hypothetical protein